MSHLDTVRHTWSHATGSLVHRMSTGLRQSCIHCMMDHKAGSSHHYQETSLLHRTSHTPHPEACATPGRTGSGLTPQYRFCKHCCISHRLIVHWQLCFWTSHRGSYWCIVLPLGSGGAGRWDSLWHCFHNVHKLGCRHDTPCSHPRIHCLCNCSHIPDDDEQKVSCFTNALLMKSVWHTMKLLRHSISTLYCKINSDQYQF